MTPSASHALEHDAMVLAVGAQAVPAVPHALTWDDRSDAETLGGLLQDRPSTSNTSGAASVVSTKTSSLGTFLVNGNGRALYLWDADHGSMSTCTGACAQAWPPLTTTGTPKASGAVKPRCWGRRSSPTARTSDVRRHPLCTFAGDTKAGQTTGEGSNGFGAPCWVVSP